MNGIKFIEQKGGKLVEKNVLRVSCFFFCCPMSKVHPSSPAASFNPEGRRSVVVVFAVLFSMAAAKASAWPRKGSALALRRENAASHFFAQIALTNFLSKFSMYLYISVCKTLKDYVKFTK